MAPTYPTATINSRLTDVINAIDAAGGNASCRLYDGGSNLLSTLQLGRPCGTVAAGVLTFSGMPWLDPAAAATGTPVSAKIVDSAGTDQVTTLTVGTGSTSYDIVLSAATITAGQTVAITTATITGR